MAFAASAVPLGRPRALAGALAQGRSLPKRPGPLPPSLPARRRFGVLEVRKPGQPRDTEDRRDTAARAAPIAAPVFTGAMLSVMPMYALMVVAPRSDVTKKLLSSRLFFAALGLVYVGMVFAGSIDWASVADVFRAGVPAATATWQDVISSYVRVPQLAAQFIRSHFTATVWTHLLLLDVVLARQLFWDAAARAVPFAHTALLCFMCGPIGILSHILTSAAASLLRTKPGVRPPPSASAVLTGSPPGPPTSTPRPSSPIPGPSVTPATPSAAAAVETLRSASQRVVMAERIAQSLVQRCTGLRVDVNRVAGGGALADEAAREADAAGDAPAADAVREAANALRAALSKAEGPMAQSARDEALRVSREARDLARSLEELTEDAARGRVGEAVAEKEAGQAAAACDRWEQQLKRAEGKVDAGVAATSDMDGLESQLTQTLAALRESLAAAATATPATPATPAPQDTIPAPESAPRPAAPTGWNPFARRTETPASDAPKPSYKDTVLAFDMPRPASPVGSFEDAVVVPPPEDAPPAPAAAREDRGAARAAAGGNGAAVPAVASVTVPVPAQPQSPAQSQTPAQSQSASAVAAQSPSAAAAPAVPPRPASPVNVPSATVTVALPTIAIPEGIPKVNARQRHSSYSM